MSADPSAILANVPFIGTAALWAQAFPVVDDTITDRAVFRPASHWIGRWGPHWPLDWAAMLDRETFEAALRKALAAAKRAGPAQGLTPLADVLEASHA